MERLLLALGEAYNIGGEKMNQLVTQTAGSGHK